MFTFPACRELKRALGDLDACVEVAELAIRAFRRSAFASPEGARGFIEALSREHGVIVNDFESNSLASLTSLLYVVAVHQALEGYLHRLRAEHPQGSTWLRADGEDLLVSIVKAVHPARELRTAPLALRLCDYYRRVRNAFVHPDIRAKVSKELSKAAPKLAAEVQRDPDLGRLAAPNEFNSVSFDDFVLFTRSAKTAALELSRAARLTDLELRQRVEEEAKKSGLAGRLRNNPNRLRKRQMGMLRTAFSISVEEADTVMNLGC